MYFAQVSVVGCGAIQYWGVSRAQLQKATAASEHLTMQLGNSLYRTSLAESAIGL